MAPTNVASPLGSRPGSACSNDRWSIASPTPFNVPNQTPNPPPAYVAAAAAGQMVADHHLNQNPDYEQAGPDYDHADPDNEDGEAQETARFSTDALGLLNTFLDQTLYSILATATSGKLKKLRPAITEVLKPRLAREAIASADEELRELLHGEGDDDDDEEEDDDVGAGKTAKTANGTDAEGVADLRNGTKPEEDSFNLLLTWKRTRLRIMVYTRHGDLEDEDEDRFLEDDEDFHHAKHQEAERAKWRGDSDSDTVADLGLVSPAAAIFLTSVIEYLAEQTIIVAGQACATRSRKVKPVVNGDVHEPKLTVLDVDMEKVALNPGLGRLWRTWRKRSRVMSTASPGRRGNFSSLGSLGSPRSVTGESSAWSEAESRRPSMAVADAEPFKRDEVPDIKEHSELEMASNIALPLPDGGDDRDVKEIEIPGLAKEVIDEPLQAGDVEQPLKRRASLSEKHEPKTLIQERPQLARLRSTSAPGLPPQMTWMEYLLGRSEQQPQAVGVEATEHDDAVESAGEHKAEDGHTSQKGLVAGAAAAVGAVVTAVVGSMDKQADAEANIGRPQTPKEIAGITTPAQVRSPAKDSLPSGSTTTSPKVLQSPKYESEQERALRAAERHVKRVSLAENLVHKGDTSRSMPGSFRDSSDGDTLRGDEGEHEHAVDDDDDLARPKHLSALPAPLRLGAKSTSPTDTQQPSSTLGAASEDVSPVSQVGVAKSLDSEAPSPVSPQATDSKKLDMASVAGPAALAVAGAAGVAGAAAAVPHITEPQPPTATTQRVDDDYDPYSSVAYPATNRYSRIDDDPHAIGVARSSDRAIPAPRTPSPQSPSMNAQQQHQGIQAQMGGYSQQRQIGLQAPNRNSAQRDSALSGHTDVNSFATAPAVVEPPPRNPDRPSSSRGPQDQRQPKVASPQVPTQSVAEARAKSAQQSPPSQAAQLSAAAAASAAARPTSSKGSRRNTNGSHDSSGLVPRPVDPSRASSESKKRDFEDLLKNGDNEPVKYTLTPVRVTDETSSSTATTLKPSPLGSERTSPAATSATTSSSATRPQPAAIGVGGASTPTIRAVETPQGADADAANGSEPAAKRKTQFIAREPRVRQESMRDFADFIRTTGPDKEMNVVPLISRTGSRQASGVPNSSGFDSTPGARRTSGMQARDPSVRPNNNNRDLVDFLREGPPGANGAASRPARSTAAPNPTLVAPFNKDDSSSRYASNQGSSASGPIPRAPQQSSTATMLSAPGDGGMPKKTRRRVKDPYAIDLDDEDEDDDLLTALPGAHGARPQRQEESLIDFLRNSAPPTDNSPRALAVGENNIHPNAATPTVNGTNGTANTAAAAAAAAAASSASRPSTMSNGPKMQVRPAGAARDARAARAESSRATSDLADFLKNSGPAGSESMSSRPGSSNLPAGKAAKMLGGAAPELQRTGSKGSVKTSKFWKRRTTIDA